MSDLRQPYDVACDVCGRYFGTAVWANDLWLCEECQAKELEHLHRWYLEEEDEATCENDEPR